MSFLSNLRSWTKHIGQGHANFVIWHKKEPLWGFLSCGNHSKYDLDIFCSGWSGWVRCTTVQSLRFVAWNMTEIWKFLWFLLKKADFQLFYPPKSPTRNAVTQKHPLIGLGTYENYAFMQKIRSLTLKMTSPGLFLVISPQKNTIFSCLTIHISH